MPLTSTTFAIVCSVAVFAPAFRATDDIFHSSTVDPRVVAAPYAAVPASNGSDYHAKSKRPDTAAHGDGTDADTDEDNKADDEDDGNDLKHDEQDEEHHASWRYHGIYGPSNWSLLHKECGTNSPFQQSPINIETRKTKFNELLLEISPIIGRDDEDNVTIVNTGHTVNFAYDRTVIRLADGGYDRTYRVVGTHFHWGEDSHSGSEHRINGKAFPLEMHVVSYDEDHYNDVSEAAAAKGNGLAVLSVLFRMSEQNNEHFSPIVSHLKDVQKPGSSVRIDYFDLKNLLPSNLRDFYRYKGSLTTPPCYESVVWTVFTTTQTISEAQLSEFRHLQERSNPENRRLGLLVNNWRSVQPIGERIVYRSFPLRDFGSVMNSSSSDSLNSKWVDDWNDDNLSQRSRSSGQNSVAYLTVFLPLFIGSQVQ